MVSHQHGLVEALRRLHRLVSGLSTYRVFTRSSKHPANVFKIHVNCWTFAERLLPYVVMELDVCWKFAGHFLDRVNTPLHNLTEANCYVDVYNLLSMKNQREKCNHSSF